MIQLAGPKDAAAVLAAARTTPVFGTMTEMYWHLWVENHKMPHQFYLVDGGAVLKLSGRHATLCGCPKDDEELVDFLGFMQVRRVEALNWRPPGWRQAGENPVLVRPPAPAPPGEAKPGFEQYPPLCDVLALLENSGELALSRTGWEDFWVDANIRRNHGVAHIWGIREDGHLVSTAGAWAITETGAYIACVATLPQARGRGHATALLRLLVQRHARRTLSLMCAPQNTGFYTRLGFHALEDRAFVCENPAEAGQEQ